MRRCLCKIACVLVASSGMVASAYAAFGCVAGFEPGTVTFHALDTTKTPPQLSADATTKVACNAVPMNTPCLCAIGHRLEGWYYDTNVPGYVKMWTSTNTSLTATAPCNNAMNSYNCTHGPFNILYKGSWELRHFAFGSSCDWSGPEHMDWQDQTLTW